MRATGRGAREVTSRFRGGRRAHAIKNTRLNPIANNVQLSSLKEREEEKTRSFSLRGVRGLSGAGREEEKEEDGILIREQTEEKS